jgi:hypothetical protein
MGVDCCWGGIFSWTVWTELVGSGVDGKLQRSRYAYDDWVTKVGWLWTMTVVAIVF